MIKLAVCGACGRMGSTVRDVIHEQKGMTVAAAVEVAGHCEVGRKIRRAVVVDDLTKVVEGVDVVVDFTHPKAAVSHAVVSAEHGKPVVIGTTGLSDKETQRVEKTSRKVPIVLSPNMSVGVNLLFKLADLISRAIPEDYDVEILEAHHRMKKDAPSGTAARLGRIVREARSISDVIYGRQGMVGERPRGQLAIHTVRAGDIVGEHSILFAGEGERFEVIHRAHNRRTFAAGVSHAVRFVVKAEPGLYDMMDVLGLREH